MIKKLGTTDDNGDGGEIMIKSKITIKNWEPFISIDIFWFNQV